MSTTAKTATAVSLRMNDLSVEIPRHAGWYEPTENLKRLLRHSLEFAVVSEDIANIIETGEIVQVEQRPAPTRLSKGRPEITFRGETKQGDRIDIDVAPAGEIVGPLGGFGSAVQDGVCEMKIIRVRRAFETFVDPISQHVCKDEDDPKSDSDD